MTTPDATTVPGYERRWLVLVVLSFSLFMVVVDNTIVNVALPTLSRELSATTSQLQWIVDAYSLVFAGLLLACGSVGDRYGRKGALIGGLLLFGVTSVIASFTTTVGTAAASDFVVEVYMTVRTVGTSGTCAVKCVVRNSAAAGFINATVNVLAASPVVYNNLNGNTKHHISLLTGASKTATITQAYVEVLPGR